MFVILSNFGFFGQIFGRNILVEFNEYAFTIAGFHNLQACLNTKSV